MLHSLTIIRPSRADTTTPAAGGFIQASIRALGGGAGGRRGLKLEPRRTPRVRDSARHELRASAQGLQAWGAYAGRLSAPRERLGGSQVASRVPLGFSCPGMGMAWGERQGPNSESLDFACPRVGGPKPRENPVAVLAGGTVAARELLRKERSPLLVGTYSSRPYPGLALDLQ